MNNAERESDLYDAVNHKAKLFLFTTPALLNINHLSIMFEQVENHSVRVVMRIE
jgi:hypothetical protein